MVVNGVAGYVWTTTATGGVALHRTRPEEIAGGTAAFGTACPPLVFFLLLGRISHINMHVTPAIIKLHAIDVHAIPNAAWRALVPAYPASVA